MTWSAAERGGRADGRRAVHHADARPPARQARRKLSGTAVVEPLNPSNQFDLNIGWALSRTTSSCATATCGSASPPSRSPSQALHRLRRCSATRTCHGRIRCRWTTRATARTSSRSSTGPRSARARPRTGWSGTSSARSAPGSAERRGLEPARRRARPAAGISPVDRVYGFGYSQTGSMLITYINAIQPRVVAEAGAPSSTASSSAWPAAAFIGAAPLNQCTPVPPARRPAALAARRGRAGDPDDVPVRLPERHRLARPRRQHAAGPLSPLRDGGRRARDAGRALLLGAHGRTSSPRAAPCRRWLQRGAAQPLPELASSSTRRCSNLDLWSRHGSRRRRAPTSWCRRASRCSTQFGNVLGGLRSPYLDVPTSTWTGSSTGDSFCFIAGHEIPFEQARLDALYPTQGSYVGAVARDVRALVAQRYLTPADGRELIREAAHTDIRELGE